MPGTTPVGAYAETASTGAAAMTPSMWFAQSDANSAVMMRSGDNFAPRPAAIPAMSVVVDAGVVTSLLPTGQQLVTEMAQQTVTITTAPATPNNRIDLIVVNAATGAASVIPGAPANSPTAPALPAGMLQVAQISVPNGTAVIGNANITDLRTVWQTGVPGVPWAVGGGYGDAITAAYLPANSVLTDGLLLAVRAPGANATTAPTFAPDGLMAHPITKLGGQALSTGDIAGNLFECLLRFNLANARWELLNPAPSAFGVFVTSSSSTLTTAQSGGTIELGGASTYVTTLPAPSNCRRPFILTNTSAFPQTIASQSGNIVYGGEFTAASFSMPEGSSCYIYPDGIQWVISLASGIVFTATSAQIVAALGYTPAPPASMGNLNAAGCIQTATAVTLTSSNFGGIIYCTGTGTFNVTVPPPTAWGQTLLFISLSANIVYVVGASINGGNAPLSNGYGGNFKLVSLGSIWAVIDAQLGQAPPPPPDTFQGN